jgi:hypothetical protein
VELTSTGVVDVRAVSVANGNLAVNNVGGISTSGAVAASGTVDMTANSPLTVGAPGIQAGGNITLTATNLTSAGNVTINGNVVSTGGAVVVSAANNLAQNATLNGLLGVSVSAGGLMTFGANSLALGSPVSYLQGGVALVPPWLIPPANAGSTGTALAPGNFVVTFLDQFLTAVDPQLLAMADPLDPANRTSDPLSVDGAQTCTP